MALARISINDVRACLAKVTQPPVKYADRKLAGPGELQPRPAAHSFARMNIPIKSKAQEMFQYMNVYNHVRIGRLLEDLDMQADLDIAMFICSSFVKENLTAVLTKYGLVNVL